MSDQLHTAVDLDGTLDELHQAVELTELDTSGRHAGPLGQVHPLGWCALGVLALAIVFHIKGSDWLIGNFAWWHWAGLVAIFAVALRPAPLKALSRFFDGLSDFFEHGANVFAHPWAAYGVLLGVTAFAGLLIGPLQPLADWVFGVEVTPVGSDFDVTSSGATGWIRTVVAAAILVVVIAGLARALQAALPQGAISVTRGVQIALVAFVSTFVIVWAFSGWQTGVTAGFAIAVLAASLAVGPLWVISWGIFFVIFFYVITRYTARFIEANIIIGEVNSLGLQLFGLLALLGVGYGVKAGVNPRIDFWWAEFTTRRKALLDFTLHALLLVPFLWAGLRLLHGYAKTNLGFKTDFSGETDGSWPASWHVWETWKQSSDAGNLPVGPVRAMIFVGFVLFLCQILSEMIKSGFVLIRREDLADLKQVDAPTRVE